MHKFILEVLDLEYLCPVLQMRFDVADADELRAMLGDATAGDPEVESRG